MLTDLLAPIEVRIFNKLFAKNVDPIHLQIYLEAVESYNLNNESVDGPITKDMLITHLPNIKLLKITNHQIPSLSANLIEVVICGNCYISSDTFSGCFAMERLYLQRVKNLRRLDLSKCGHLEFLEIIRDYDWTTCIVPPSLIYLSLHGVDEWFNFKPFINVKMLCLNDCQTVDISDLPNLEHLIIRAGRNLGLGPYQICDMPKLKILTIYGKFRPINEIKFISNLRNNNIIVRHFS
jgi:hypothetical protein